MGLDSTAELLFKINANTDDAQGNIAKFRTLLSKDLSDIEAEFESWSTQVFGQITSVQGAMLAGSAAIAAGFVAIGAAISEANKHFDEYANTVSQGMKLTGMQAEQMSTVVLLAEKTGVSYDSISAGLSKFSALVIRASEGNKQAQRVFHDLGISQDEVVAGQRDLYPLLQKTMDAFQGNTSAVQKLGFAREAFSRDPTLLNFLNKGSEGLEAMRQRADALGLTLGKDDIEAARKFSLAMKTAAEETESAWIRMGRTVQTIRLWWATAYAAIIRTTAETFDSNGPVDATFQRFFTRLSTNFAAVQKEIEKAVKGADPGGSPTPPLVAPKQIKEVTANFYELSNILESINSKIAASGTKYTQLTNELQHYEFEIQKAAESLKNAHDTGKITEDEFQRNTALLAQMPDKLTQLLHQSLGKLTAEERAAAEARVAALDQVHAELAEKLAVADSQDYEQQRASLEKQMAQLREASAKKAQLGNAENALLAQIRQSGLNKIARDEQQAFLTEIEQLQQHLEQMVKENLSAKDKLGFQYQQDLRQFSAVEEAKALALHKGEAQQATIRAFYDQIRSQSLQKYQQDLQTLQNSQGWRGVFGDEFASSIRRNEALTKEWATTTNQAAMSVTVAMEAMKEMVLDAFKQEVEAMGQAIVHAFIYEQSIGKAMRAATAAVLEALASQAAAKAIFELAEGLALLATGDVGDAGKAFAAAAMFGSLSAVAAVTGRAIAPKDATGTSASAAGSSSSTSTSSGATSASSGSDSAQPAVFININGSVIGPSGASELCDIINQAVYQNDATLYASHSKTGVPIK